MNRRQFIDIMKSPGQLNAESLGQLEKIIESYPYFQTARTLFLLNLNQQKHIDFGRQLKITAAYASDRFRLRELIREQGSHDDQKDTLRAPERKKEDEAPLTAKEEIFDSQHLKIKEMLSELEDKIRADMEEIEQKKSHLDELLHQKDQLIEETEYSLEGKEAAEKRKLKPLPKDKLLDDFLQESFKDRPVTAFFDPVESARQSIIEDEDLVSETLAKIVASQGNIPKAIKIYKRLSLKFPKKSSYFAAQIKKLEESK